MHATVHSADVQDRHGGLLLLSTLLGRFPYLEKLFADGAYQGPIFADGLERFLAMMLAALNLLAFAWHTVLDLLEPPWQAARQAAVKRTSFFAHILMLSAYVLFPSWQVFLQSLATFSIPPDLINVRHST